MAAVPLGVSGVESPNAAHRRTSMPYIFGAATTLLVALFQWPRRWIFSGAPLLTLILLLGASNGSRILPVVPLWTIFATLHLAYAVAATSWLLYGLFAALCYQIIFLACLFQFAVVSNFVRRNLRSLLQQLHFVNDKIAFFNIPALEIDTEVDGLMVIRGITISLSSLTLVAHGVEVGIKLTDDLELSIQTENVTIPLFRRIEIGDCFANIKGGHHEMTFRAMDGNTESANGDAVMAIDTPLLKAAATNADMSQPQMVKMTSKMTDGRTPRASSAKTGFESIKQLSSDDSHAQGQYQSILNWIQESNDIHKCRESILKSTTGLPMDTDFDVTNDNVMRAAVCSNIHNLPSVPHPPRISIKVTTLQNLSPPIIRRLLHKLPMLLRLLLNPLSYFHPVFISSITAAGSGKWITHLLQQKIFQHYSEENAELRRLQERMSLWLSDANFAFELANITGLARVPLLSAFDIVCQIGIGDVMAYRALANEVKLKEVVRLGGADAAFVVPTFLLPHHEHLLPPIPTRIEFEDLERDVDEADGKPNTLIKERVLEQAEQDETNVKISVHARLPACFNQELLNFISALVKATKVVELEKEPNAMDQEVHGFKEFTKSLNQGMKDGMKKAMVDGVINDRFIAKMVGKITKKLETVQGDVGYSGDIPVALAHYRLPEGHPELSKILP